MPDLLPWRARGPAGPAGPAGPPADAAVLAELARAQRFSVRATGAAVGDGVTDDRAAIQATIDAAVAAGGGIIVFEALPYMIGAPGLTVPANSLDLLRFQGAGMGGTKTAAQGTRLTRNGGHALFTAQGTGIADGQQVQGLELRDMSISGNGFVGDLLVLRRCSDVVIKNVRLTNTPACALFATQAWNWRIYNLVVNTSGDQPGDKPAVLFTDEAAGGTNSNTVLISGSTFEANLWTDIRVDASAASVSSAAVQITNSKFERSVGYAVEWVRASLCSITNCFMHSNGANGVLRMLNVDSCVFANNNVDLHANGTAAEAIRVEGGNVPIITGNTFWTHVVAGTPRAINLVAAGITAASIFGNGYQGTWTAFVTDNRATPRGIFERGGHLQAFDGLSTKSKNGVISDADFLKTPPNGTIVVDELNSKIGVRVAGVWKWVTVA